MKKRISKEKHISSFGKLRKNQKRSRREVWFCRNCVKRRMKGRRENSKKAAPAASWKRKRKENETNENMRRVSKKYI